MFSGNTSCCTRIWRIRESKVGVDNYGEWDQENREDLTGTKFQDKWDQFVPIATQLL